MEVVKVEAIVVPGESREKGGGRAALISGKNDSDVIVSGAPETTRRASKDVKANNRGEKRRALLCMKESSDVILRSPLSGQPCPVLLLSLLHSDSKIEVQTHLKRQFTGCLLKVSGF